MRLKRAWTIRKITLFVYALHVSWNFESFSPTKCFSIIFSIPISTRYKLSENEIDETKEMILFKRSFLTPLIADWKTKNHHSFACVHIIKHARLDFIRCNGPTCASVSQSLSFYRRGASYRVNTHTHTCTRRLVVSMTLLLSAHIAKHTFKLHSLSLNELINIIHCRRKVHSILLKSYKKVTIFTIFVKKKQKNSPYI